jgi:hypothetical protein
MHTFYAEHGEPKKSGVRENEEYLAQRIVNLRQAKKKGVNPEVCARVQREFPWWSWDPLADALERTITQLHNFYAVHGEPKKDSVRENEHSLSIWIKNIRQNKKKGLNPELCARIEREFPWWSWDVFADAFERTIKLMHVFYAAHGVPKNCGVRENEASLATWISYQRKNKKKGKNPELCARIEQEFPWWKWTPRTDDSVDMSPEEPDVSTSKTKKNTIYFQNSFKNSTDDASDMSEEPGNIEEDPEVEEVESDLTDSEASLEPKRKRDGLDELTKEELLERLRKRQARGYTAPNPAAKDDINALFAGALPPDGLVVFLDHVDFKTARACLAQGVPASAMVIPQRDPATFAQMRLDPVFGASVRQGDFNAVFESLQAPIRGVYADFTGALKCGLDFVAVCERVEFAPGAVVAVTITLRNPEGNDQYPNADIETLSSALGDIGLRSLKLQGERVPPKTYGVGQPMVTVFKVA